MRNWPRALILPLFAAALGAQGVGTILIDNPVGNVTVRVVGADRANVNSSCRTRELRAGDIQIDRQADTSVVKVAPSDGAPIDVEFTLPYNYRLQVRVTSGSVTIEGVIHRAEVLSETGDLHFKVPWTATRLGIDATEPPKELVEAPGYRFSKWTSGRAQPRAWYMRDRLRELKITASLIVVKTVEPGRIVLEDMPIPPDWRVKPPWLAPPILDEIVAGQRRTSGRRRPRSKPKLRPEAPEQVDSEATTVEGGMPRFSSDVRMVNLAAAVFDSHGRPLAELERDEFEVIENGVPQDVRFVGAEDVPFNLVLLLDMSGSTRRDREAMKEAAKRFIDIARPNDRVGAYALANNLFQVVATLTDDREKLKNLIEAIPEVSGGTPLYDMIVLSYAHELRQLPMDRNALIVISDGVDNQVYGTGAASESPFRRLRQAADGLNMLLYPIVLDPFTTAPAPGWSKKAKANMQALADATGGRLFVAQSIRDLDPVYPQVAEELRSVYTVAYYPADQEFDGAWRNVEVRVKRRGARVRTRSGYYAK